MGVVVERVVDAPPKGVHAVLGDGWLYAVWVVGATHVRDVDDEWPAVGSRLYHRVGVWPVTIKDFTEVVESKPGELLVLRVRAWPVGEGQVRLEMHPEGDGTRIIMHEKPTTGPAKLIPPVLINWLLRARNHETLARLASIVEKRIPG
jgi:uncharacterized protein YndB with AHSA1/START domain